MALAAQRARTVPGTAPLQLYKNNIDGKGASYGTHENYLWTGHPVRRASSATSPRSSSAGRS